ncbi:TPA: RNA-splicing ligase RtcB, partial [Candidatus Bathyarchaeota archaeon]|nr:RNA-splicing ligase RtcB [Candidatus Bathyarchaeota archaeon]
KTDRTLLQCANVATLKGIYKYAITMPDGHEGYGFPIGGVAATDYNEGVISPGGVGYDINCLPPETRILMEHECWLPIREVVKGGPVLCLNNSRVKTTRVVYGFCREESYLYDIYTKTGLKIQVTADHPILTVRGMIKASELKPGVKIATHPFEGVKHETPKHFTILSENEFDEKISRELEKRGLIPLYSDSQKLPILIKLLGYFIGDGAFDGKKTWFYGSIEGLKELQSDIEKIGYRPSRILVRRKQSNLHGRKFIGTENSIYVSAKSFRALLEKLGAPAGKKASTKFTVPTWLTKLPKWLKRLFLAAYCGAEMNKPQTINGYNFEQPFISLTKDERILGSGIIFLEKIAELAEEFGVETSNIFLEKFKGKVRLKLVFSEKPTSLLNLWSRIGYIYNPEKRRLALTAVNWIRWQQKIIEGREKVAEVATSYHASGMVASKIISDLSSSWVNRRFIERSMWEGRKTNPRIPKGFPAFEKWAAENTCGDLVWDEIEKIRVEPYNGLVYDITIEDEAHNFVAEGFVVSNCGVRLLRTNLTEKDVRPKLGQFLEAIFRNVPSGLGSKGKIRLSPAELDRVIVEGINWALERGYGWAEDREHCEEYGCMEGANPDKISSVAKRRGAPELGTLGSGNHFLEIQRVDKIFDSERAKTLGIFEEGQVTVMIHTGSRGFGHQICSDYLRIMDRAVRRYGITLPDRELACVPGHSPEGRDYFSAMAGAVNYAFTNRQCITHWVREAFNQVLNQPADRLGLELIYDVAHNICKIEEHEVEGGRRKVFVHRKGATRAFPPGHPVLPKTYQLTGQPVLIAGTMGTSSWILIGTPKAMELSFGSTAHGAGRYMSRRAATRQFGGHQVKKELEGRGILVRAASMTVVAEEAPRAYKDVDRVAEVSHRIGIGTKVVRLVPLGVVKG